MELYLNLFLPKVRPVPRGTRKDTTGLFNTLTHYLNLAQFGDDEEHYPSEWEDEARKTIDAVKMKDIFSESRYVLIAEALEN